MAVQALFVSLELDPRDFSTALALIRADLARNWLREIFQRLSPRVLYQGPTEYSRGPVEWSLMGALMGALYDGTCYKKKERKLRSWVRTQASLERRGSLISILVTVDHDEVDPLFHDRSIEMSHRDMTAGSA